MSDEQPQLPAEEPTPLADEIKTSKTSYFTNLGFRLLGVFTFFGFTALTVWAVIATRDWWPIPPLSITMVAFCIYAKVKNRWHSYVLGISEGLFVVVIVGGLVALAAGLCFGAFGFRIR
jgi:hypothetical protein